LRHALANTGQRRRVLDSSQEHLASCPVGNTKAGVKGDDKHKMVSSARPYRAPDTGSFASPQVTSTRRARSKFGDVELLARALVPHAASAQRRTGRARELGHARAMWRVHEGGAYRRDALQHSVTECRDSHEVSHEFAARARERERGVRRDLCFTFTF